jgi:O-antigen/teichoic acid export membrane protein
VAVTTTSTTLDEPTPPRAPRDKAKYRSALSWSVAMVGGQQFVTAAVAFLLAAILGPEAFGTVAMASVYILFMQMLLQQAIPAIVQRKDLDSAHLDSAFWLVMGFTLVITGISVALAGPWAAANRTPDLQPIIIALSLQVPLQGLVVVQEAVLRRHMDFRSLAIRSLVAAAGGGVIGLALAFMDAGTWALVGQQVGNSIIGAAVLWKVSDWRPRLHFSRAHAKDLAGFSLGAALASLAAFVNVRSDAMLIGLFFGAYAVGLYRLASRFTEIFVDFLSRSMQQVAFPELSRLQHDPVAFARRKRDIMKQSSLMTLPALGILAGCADQLLRLFGPEWAPASAALQLLCIVAAVRALSLISSAGLQAIGRPHVLAALSWIAAALSAGALVAAGLALRDASTSDQVVGMAASRAVVYVFVITPVYLYVIDRYCLLPVRRMLSAVGGPALVGFAAAGVGYLWTATGVDESWPPLVAVIVAGIVTTAVGGALLSIVARAEVVRALGLVGRILTKPSWRPGYRPRHIRAALVEQVLLSSPMDVEYEPRHLASRTKRSSGRIQPRTDSNAGTAYNNDAASTRLAPTSVSTSSPPSGAPSQGPAPTNSERPGGWSPVESRKVRLDQLRGALNVDLWSSIGVMVRRWKVTVPLLVLTAVASIAIGGMISPDYQASTTLLLVGPGSNAAGAATEVASGETTTTTVAPPPPPPGAPTTATTVDPSADDQTPNPLLSLNSSLISTARASLESINDDGVRRELREDGLSTTYEVTVAVRDPIMQIVVSGTSGDQVTDTLAALQSTLVADLQARQDQAGATERSRIQVQTLAETNQPNAIYESRRRAQLVIVALGLVLSAVGAFAAEGFMQRRAGRATLPDGRSYDLPPLDGPDDDIPDAPVGGRHTALNGNGNGHGGNGGHDADPYGDGRDHDPVRRSVSVSRSSSESAYGDDDKPFSGDRWP